MRSILVGALLGGLFTACASSQHTETRDLGDGAVVSLTLQPFPLAVGNSAEMFVTLRYLRTSGTGCRVQYRSYAVNIGSADAVWQDVPEQSRSGIYKTLNPRFTNDGKWLFEFNIDCGERFARRGVKFELPVSAHAPVE